MKNLQTFEEFLNESKLNEAKFTEEDIKDMSSKIDQSSKQAQKMEDYYFKKSKVVSVWAAEKGSKEFKQFSFEGEAPLRRLRYHVFDGYFIKDGVFNDIEKSHKSGDTKTYQLRDENDKEIFMEISK
jgi:hypothetical protein